MLLRSTQLRYHGQGEKSFQTLFTQTERDSLRTGLKVVSNYPCYELVTANTNKAEGRIFYLEGDNEGVSLLLRLLYDLAPGIPH